MNKSVSIVTIVRNAPEDLEATLSSVANQISLPLEHLIIDGASFDRTVVVANLFQKSHSEYVRFYSEPDSGISDALNKGVKLSKGDYIICLNAGDQFYDSTSLQRIKTELQGIDTPTILYGDALLCYPHYSTKKPWVNHKHFNSLFSFFNPLCHQSMAVPRELMLEYPFSEYLKYSMDLKLWLTFIDNNMPFKYLPEYLCRYKMGGISSTRKNIYPLLKEHRLVYFESGRFYKIVPYALLCIRLLLENFGGAPIEKLIMRRRIQRQ
jgi:glycosyltransferase involved in cell wall biosynthesis